MFGIGFMELIVVAVVVLMFVGPRRLPDLMRQGGRLFVRVRRMSAEVKSSFDKVIHEAEQELDAEKQLKQELTAAVRQQINELEADKPSEEDRHGHHIDTKIE